MERQKLLKVKIGLTSNIASLEALDETTMIKDTPSPPSTTSNTSAYKAPCQSECFYNPDLSKAVTAFTFAMETRNS